MKKTLILMDWRGTLSTVPDPVALIKTLQASGHYVVMHSNSSHDTSAIAAFEACDDVLSKLTATAEKVELVKKAVAKHGLESVVLVDDEACGLTIELFKAYGIDLPRITIEELTEALDLRKKENHFWEAVRVAFEELDARHALEPQEGK